VRRLVLKTFSAEPKAYFLQKKTKRTKRRSEERHPPLFRFKTRVAPESFWNYKSLSRAMPRQAKPFTAIRHIAPDGSTAIVVPKHSMSANY